MKNLSACPVAFAYSIFLHTHPQLLLCFEPLKYVLDLIFSSLIKTNK